MDREAEGWGIFLIKPIIIKHEGPHCTETIYVLVFITAV
jgi:hypothetical protein